MPPIVRTDPLHLRPHLCLTHLATPLFASLWYQMEASSMFLRLPPFFTEKVSYRSRTAPSALPSCTTSWSHYRAHELADHALSVFHVIAFRVMPCGVDSFFYITDRIENTICESDVCIIHLHNATLVRRNARHASACVTLSSCSHLDTRAYFVHSGAFLMASSSSKTVL